MSGVHIYTTHKQPAIRYKVPGLKHVFRCKPRTLFWVGCCKRRRIAANVELQVYYDGTYAWCREGKGCK